MNKSPIEKNYTKKRIGNKKPMTKDEYNNKGAKLLALLLLVFCATPFINSYIPLIVSAILLFGFIIVSRIKYGYKAIEARELTAEEKRSSSSSSIIKSTDYINDPMYSHLPCNVYYDD